MKSLIIATILLLTSIIGICQIADKAEDISPLLIGESIPNGKLVNANNEPIQLQDVISQKPTVLVFYRGGWCPYCNKQLSALAETETEIIKLGYQIIAVSPESYENIKPTSTADKLNYTVLSDPEGSLIQKTGIAFHMPAAYKGFITTKTKGKLSEILPVPTVMILNTKGEILFEYINPNFKIRLSKELLLAVLPVLK